MSPAISPRILFAGNPNCGKTSLFNALTGSRQKVGNYPGITVERRAAPITLQEKTYELVDLPGTYSLIAYSPEERVTQAELLARPEDVVVVVADATNLKRGLVLLAQLFRLPRRTVLCLNMIDEATRAGQVLDLVLLEKLLGVKVVATAAHRGQGIDELREALERVLASPPAPARPIRSDLFRSAVQAIATELGDACPAFSRDFVAIMMLLEQPSLNEQFSLPEEAWARAIAVARKQRTIVEASSKQDISLFVTNYHFGLVDGLLRQVILTYPREDAREFSNRIDRFLVHPWLGGPLFLLILYALFFVTFQLGAYPMGWLENAMVWLADTISDSWPEAQSSPLYSLLVDGVLGGVGGVLVFLPNILILFLGLSLLEDTGYMARAAFIMDRIMHRFGLHGRSFVPMVTGLGCTVPGMMATRTIESERDRLTTLFVLPLMSCGARLPIWMLLIPAFFPASLEAPALFGIYLLGIVLSLLLALLMRKAVLRGEDAPFVMELPPYRMPTFRSALTMAAERGLSYLRKAGTTILGVSIVMWAITSYPKAEVTAPHSGPATSTVQASQDLEASLAGRLGHFMEPALTPIGLDWRVGVGLVGAFAAKEVFVAQVGVVYALADDHTQRSSLRSRLAADYTPAAGLALIVFLLVATPCMATVAVMRRESGSWKWALSQFFGLTLFGYGLALVAYQLGRLLL